jgi:hypothetical protein
MHFGGNTVIIRHNNHCNMAVQTKFEVWWSIKRKQGEHKVYLHQSSTTHAVQHCQDAFRVSMVLSR